MTKTLSERNLIVLIFVTHFICAIFSTGFHHFDEHFQIIEFLGTKLGLTPISDLSWEYTEQIRPWFQVLFYYPFAALAKALNLSPFSIAAILRIVSTLIGAYSIIKLAEVAKAEFGEKIGSRSLLFLAFAWFIPYIHARTSSENLTASLFILGFYCIHLRKSFFWGALILGASFLTRYQTGLMIAPLFFFYLFISKEKFSNLAKFAIAIIISCGIGTLVDYWGYGEWTFGPWNYFKVNLLEGRASNFGTDPFWYYFKSSLLKGIPPVSLIFIIATLLFWKKYPKNVLTWITLPFILCHSLISHKELRFIFPMIIFAPIFLAIFIEKFNSNKFGKWGVKLSVYVNLLLLIIVIFRAANPSVNFYKFVYKQNLASININDESPYSMVGLPINFYRPKELQITEGQNGGIQYFKKGQDFFKTAELPECENIFLAYPRWILSFNIGNWMARSRVWSLFDCKQL